MYVCVYVCVCVWCVFVCVIQHNVNLPERRSFPRIGRYETVGNEPVKRLAGFQWKVKREKGELLDERV